MEEESTNSRRNEAMLRQQLRRARMSQEQMEANREANTQRRQQLRQSLSQQRREQILEQDAAQHRNVREQLSQEQREQILQENAAQHRNVREQLSQEQREQILQENAAQHMNAREQLSQEQREQILEQDAAQHRRRRDNNQRLTLNMARRYDIDALLQVDVDISRHSCGLMEVRCHHCDALMYLGERTGGTINNPNFGICCKSGMIQIPSIPELPGELADLFTINTPESKYFRNNIRRFNSAMAMCSMKVDDATILRGIANYRIHGIVYRFIGVPRNQVNDVPSCLQTYFYDPEEQIRKRIERMPINNANQAFDENIFRKIHSAMMVAENTYLQSFLSVQEQIDAGNIPADVSIGLHADKKPDHEHTRRYNLPTSNELAILIPDDLDEETNNTERMVVTKFRAENNQHNLQTFSDSHRSYDPMMYPCFFPSGLDGWHLGLLNQNGNRQISIVQFYSYRIMKRGALTNILHLGKRLFQQYCVDQFAKVQSSRLRYIRHNQTALRAELYNGLADAIVAGAADRTGRRCILPSSFTGSPRYMVKHYQDAMAIVRKFGKPTLFVTLTCNPKWPEIENELSEGQTAVDRPDITARVFKLKQQQLLQDIKGGVLGKIIAHVNTVEFQKRGLPHCHFLFIIENHHNTWQEIDKVVSSEMPNPENPRTSRLYNLVKKHMIHGPCGADNLYSPCMVNGTCTKRYPREYRSQTFIGNDSYPQYRRRSPMEGGFNASIRIGNRDVAVDNRHVVPYNAWLLQKYEAHINVEWCASIKAVKYLYKYIFKGTDHSTVSLNREDDHVRLNVGDENQLDEVLNYENCRYIGASEACWRLFEFPIQQRQPAVECLPIHLPDQQIIVFNPNNAQQALEQNRSTKLISYFKMNEDDPLARNVLYCDFPQYYTWNNSNRCWRRRARQTEGTPEAIGRVYAVHPSQGELFYLRLLLQHKTGATSFNDLLTVNGILCEHFKHACQMMNLLENDQEWELCLNEARTTHSAEEFRNLFICILQFCCPSRPLELYNMFREDLCEDYLHQIRQFNFNDEEALEMAVNDMLCELDHHMAQYDRSTTFFGLPAANHDLRRNNDPINADEIDPNAETFLDDNIQLLNEDQRIVFENVQRKIDRNEGGLIFIDAPGGTGKTFLLNILLSYVRKNRDIAIATASSGIAATLLKLGRTAHSRFKLPIPVNSNSTCKVSPIDATGRLLHDARLIVWDESPMCHRHLFEALDRTLKDVMNNDLLFGGKLIILGGDFRQILPVVRRAQRPTLISACLKKSVIWRDCEVFHLNTNMRVQNCLNNNDITSHARLTRHSDWLLQLGEGRIPNVEGTVYTDVIEIPMHIKVNTKEELIDHVYEELHNNFNNVQWLSSRAILTTKNEEVDKLNTEIMQKLPGEAFTLRSIDSVADEQHAALYPAEFLNSLNISGMPPHIIKLKVGAPIMLLRNLDQRNGHCNGARYKVLSISDTLITASKMTGVDVGRTLLIPRIVLQPSDTDLPFTLRRRQFPIRPAFVMSINKSQGQSLFKCGIYLTTPVFTHGQLYVAVSRVGDPVNLKIFSDQREFIRSDRRRRHHNEEMSALTRNVVYTEII